MGGTSGPQTVSTRRQRIAELAKRAPSMRFTTLAHHIDVDWLREAYTQTRKDGATGVDGQTAARQVMEVLPKRFGKYGLTLHPEKTRLVPFRRSGRDSQRSNLETKPQSGHFDLLGFTHYWGRTPWGSWVIKRKTASDRFSRALRKIAVWCRLNRHMPLTEQHRILGQKLRGHDAYYGITGNFRCLQRLRFGVTRIWRKWLSRRKRGNPLPWDCIHALLQRFPLPPPRVVHSVYRS